MNIKNGVLISVLPDDIPEDGRFIIPDGITSIGEWAFSSGYKPISVTIPDSVTSIGSHSFRGCYGLTSITIPDSVTSIGDHAFYACAGLTSVIIGNGVTSIGDWAFYSCLGLSSITIPGNVVSIGRNAFRECSLLKTIIVGNGVMSINMGAFHNTPLRSVNKNYKAFHLSPNGNLVCLKKTYKVGKRSSVRGMLSLCENGIHYCTNLFEIFDYYYGEYGKDFVIAECEVSNEQKGVDGVSKKCARWIIPQRILTREEVIQILNEGNTKK